ncbi:conserved protein, unknown function, partial [Hepatocystis sp. ex Piliocolobus tephrosceles]
NKLIYTLSDRYIKKNKLSLISEEENEKKKIIFLAKQEITTNTIINFIFALTLNNINNNYYYYYYNILLQYMHALIKNFFPYKIKSSSNLNKTKITEYEQLNKLINFLSINNFHLLCIIYTYLYVNNILFKLKIINLYFFLFIINNYTYINSMYLCQHKSSKIHNEITSTVYFVNKKNKRCLVVNECFIFPYYIDIYLKKM